MKHVTAVRVERDPRVAEDVRIRVEGRSFLKNMVRIMAGTLVDIGRGHRPVSHVAESLDSRDRRVAGPTAPPHGLVLQKVLWERPA